MRNGLTTLRKSTLAQQITDLCSALNHAQYREASLQVMYEQEKYKRDAAEQKADFLREIIDMEPMNAADCEKLMAAEYPEVVIEGGISAEFKPEVTI